MTTNTTRPSITRFILYPLVGVVAILLAGFAILFLQFFSGVHKSDIEDTLRTTETAFRSELDERVDKLTLALFQLSNNPELVKEFLSRDRIGLQEAALETFEEFETKHNVTHFYFTNIDQTNFLRVHKPERHGDVILRSTMLRAVTTGEVAHGIELGALGTLTLRVVYPWRVDGKLIGYMELGEEIENLLRTISEKFKPTLTVAIQKQYLDRNSWRTGMEMLGREAIWDQFDSYILLEPEQTTLAGQSIVDSLHRHPKNSQNVVADVTSIDGSTHRVLLQHLVDADGRNVGHFIYSLNTTGYTESVWRTIFLVVGICLALAIIVWATFAVVVRRLETKVSQAEASRARSYSQLEERVEERTRDLTREIAERTRAETDLKQTTQAAELLRKIAVAANHADNPDDAIRVCLDEVCAYSGWPVGHAYMLATDGTSELGPTKLWHIDDPGRYETFRHVTEETAFQLGVGLPGRVAATCEPHWLPFALADKDLPRAKPAIDASIKTGFAFPVMVGREVAAVLEFFSGESVERDAHLLSIAEQVGVLMGRVIERQRMEDDRAASQRRLAGIVDIAPEAVISIDTAGRIQLFNQGAEAVFGYAAGEVMGRPLDLLLPERFRAGHGAMIDRFIRTPEASRLMSSRATVSALRKDGTEFPAEASISKLVLPNEIVMTVMLRDITERLRAEEAMLTAKEEAELASRSKSEFIANMSHELRTPLNAINGFSELLAEEAFGPLGNEEYRKFSQAINDSGQHLLELINDVLDISKIEAGSAELSEETFDVMPVIDSCITMIGERAAEGGVELVVDIAEAALPQLHADKTRVKQVVLNLLSNAVKFTESGGRVILKAWHNEGNGFVLQVIDTGIGIAADDIPKALARFQQVEGGLNRRHEGTGLGLPLAKSFVEQHGGSLDLQSQLGVGTTATMRLPAARTMMVAA